MRCSGLNWPNQLPWVLLELCSAPREDNGFSPAQAVYGAPLNLPADHPDLLNTERPLEQALESFHTIPDAASLPTMRHNTAPAKAQLETIPECGPP